MLVSFFLNGKAVELYVQRGSKVGRNNCIKLESSKKIYAFEVVRIFERNAEKK